jgi:hypothetical protein
MSDIIRTPRDGCFELRSNSWGAFLSPVADPESNATLEDGALKSFELHADIAPIPASLWSRWVQLCFHFVDKVQNTSEVSCRLLRHEDDKSKWRILIPQQSVDGAAVRVNSFDEAIDIETGDVITEYPPQGWVPCGSSHSHNTMNSFFSGTDDRYELGDPGLHIVVGSINLTARTYTLVASITANKRRFEIPFQAVIDTAPLREPFHPDVLHAVTIGIAPSKAWGKYDISKNHAIKQDSGKTPKQNLRFSPNAGNGYPAIDEFDDYDAMDRPLFTSGNSFDVDLYDINDFITNYANDCMANGDFPGVDQMLTGIRNLLMDIEQAVYSDTDFHQTNDDPQSEHSAVASYPTAARALPPSQWDELL